MQISELNTTTITTSTETSIEHHAVKEGDFDRVKDLIDKGADFKVKNNDGMTSLHVAAKKGY